MIATMRPDIADAARGPAVPSLVVRGLACRRGERILFDGFDLDLRPGDLVWLRAANGFGKTSLLRLLVGLAKPEAGSVDWTTADAPLHLAHANGLKDDLTVTESLRYMVALHGIVTTDATIADAIGRLGLHAKRHVPIRALSQGQRRRVALCRLCLSPARATWVLDEPYDALDAEGVALVGELLVALARGGGSALFTSHVTPALGDLPNGVDHRTVRLDGPSSLAA